MNYDVNKNGYWFSKEQLEEHNEQIRLDERKKIMEIVDSADDIAQAMYLLGQYIIGEELKEQNK